MKKIVVIGSNGLVGRHFSELFQKKYKIICVNRQNQAELEQSDEQIDSLVFLAQSKDYNLKEFSEDLFNTNVALLRHYLHKFSGKCKQVILFSTGSVYQESKDEINENSPIINHHLTPYVASKLMSELLAESYSSFYPHIAIVRPFGIYGKGQKASMLFSRLLNSFKSGTAIEVGQNEGILFNPLHAEDAANFIDYLIGKDAQGLDYFNLFGPETLTLMAVIKKIGGMLELSPNIALRQDWPFKKNVASTLNHDFNPAISVEKGLLKMIDFARETA